MKQPGLGRKNKLAGQIGEYLVCAELGKRDLIATPFAGNVPAFDILIADEHCRTLPIQVKASRGTKFPTNAREWMDLAYDSQTRRQVCGGPSRIANPDLIYVHVAIAAADAGKDRFYILTKAELQVVCIKAYSTWMSTHEWRRPKNPESYDLRYEVKDIAMYENNWALITDRLAAANSPIQLPEDEGPNP